jgi:CBS domain-containing protein
MKVGDILETKDTAIRWIRPSASMALAAHLMREHKIGALVVSHDGDHLDGLITEREVAWGLTIHGADLPRQPVRELMLKSVPTCTPDDPLRLVMTAMTERRLRHLPVLEDGRVRGIVSIGDVVKRRLEELELESRVLHDAYVAMH